MGPYCCLIYFVNSIAKCAHGPTGRMHGRARGPKGERAQEPIGACDQDILVGWSGRTVLYTPIIPIFPNHHLRYHFN